MFTIMLMSSKQRLYNEDQQGHVSSCMHKKKMKNEKSYELDECINFNIYD